MNRTNIIYKYGLHMCVYLRPPSLGLIPACRSFAVSPFAHRFYRSVVGFLRVQALSFLHISMVVSCLCRKRNGLLTNHNLASNVGRSAFSECAAWVQGVTKAS